MLLLTRPGTANDGLSPVQARDRADVKEPVRRDQQATTAPLSHGWRRALAHNHSPLNKEPGTWCPLYTVVPDYRKKSFHHFVVSTS